MFTHSRAKGFSIQYVLDGYYLYKDGKAWSVFGFDDVEEAIDYLALFHPEEARRLEVYHCISLG